MWVSIIGQILTGVIALIAILKDRAAYGAISQRFGRRLPIILVVVIVVITALTVSKTWRDTLSEARNLGRNEELGNQLKVLSTRILDLQTKVNTEPLLRQNSVLLKELQDIREQVVAAKSRLEQPADLAKLKSTFGNNIKQPDITQISLRRQADGTVEFTIYVVNSSTVHAKNVNISLRLCKDCSFAKEPERSNKPIGSMDYDREIHYQILYAGLTIAIPLKIKTPTTVAHQFEYKS